MRYEDLPEEPGIEPYPSGDSPVSQPANENPQLPCLCSSSLSTECYQIRRRGLLHRVCRVWVWCRLFLWPLQNLLLSCH